MSRVSLYYPLINIPNEEWLKTAILYTDKVGSIVPFDNLKTAKISDNIKELNSYGFFQPFYASELTSMPFQELDHFQKLFIDVIKSAEFQAIKKSNKKFEPFALYTRKIIDGIEEALLEQGLIEFQNAEQIHLEHNAAIIYMSLLSDLFARTDKNFIVTPTTDEKEYERLAFQTTSQAVLTYQVEFQNCLPTVSPNASLIDVINFKREREKELMRFRSVLDEIQASLIEASTEKERNDLTKKWAEKMELELKDLQEMYGESKVGFALKSFTSILDFKKPEGIGTAAGAIGVGKIVSAATVAAAGYAAGALGVTVGLASSYRKQVRKLAKEPYSLIYYANKDKLLTL